MGPVVNPFWSVRARDEAALQNSRPVDLPVPSGDEADLDQVLEGGTSVQVGPGEATSLEETRGRSGKGQGSDGAGRERFSTPASWQDGRTQGQLGSGSGSVKQELPKRTEGEMPPDDGGQSLFGGSVTEENGFQRALEKEMGRKTTPRECPIEIRDGTTEEDSGNGGRWNYNYVVVGGFNSWRGNTTSTSEVKESYT